LAIFDHFWLLLTVFKLQQMKCLHNRGKTSKKKKKKKIAFFGRFWPFLAVFGRFWPFLAVFEKKNV